MQIGIELQQPFSYSIIPIIILLIVLIILPLIFFVIKKYKKRKSKTKEIVIISKNINVIKKIYMDKINVLQNNFNNKKITNRKAYQELSSLVRAFVYEITGLETHTFTLNDISKLNMPMLYELVKEYYDPEFSKLSRGNIKQSIERTKEVIIRWN